MSNRKVLIVDDDEVLGRVLSRVLAQQGHTVYQASNTAEAREMADRYDPEVALVDLCLPDGNGTELGRELRSRHPGMVQILMTAYPLRMSEHPELHQEFNRVFTKPLDLKEVRGAVASLEATDGSAATAASPPGSLAPPSAPPTEPALGRIPLPPPSGKFRWKTVLNSLVVLLVLVAAALAFWGLPQAGIPPIAELLKHKAEPEQQTTPTETLARLDPNDPTTLIVPPDVARQLGIRTVRVVRSTATRPLELSGYLGNDINRTVTVNTLFTGRVESIGMTIDPYARDEQGNTAGPRELTFKDHVKEGQLLAVIYSKDLGEKKSELVDYWSAYRLDEQNLKTYEELYSKSLTAEANVRIARRAVETDLNNVGRVEHTLAIWQVSRKDIEALKSEAEHLLDLRRTGNMDAERERTEKQAQLWARVELKAPFDGVIVERNISKGAIVDPSKDLFKITAENRLTVYAHAYEESLSSLLALPPEKRLWTVRLKADPNFVLPGGRIEQIGSVDANQHTVPLMGSAKNPGGRLIAGQFITATIQLPPEPNELAIPTSALIDTGRDSYVLVQPHGEEDRYQVMRVTVVRRSHEHVYIRWTWPQVLTFLATQPRPADPVALALSAFFQGSEDGRFLNPLREFVKPEEMRVVTDGNLVLLAQIDELRGK